MKKILIASLAMISGTAFAQTPSTAASQANTSTASVSEVKAAVASKWGAAAVIEATTGMQDRNENGNQASLATTNVISASYKLTETDKLTVAGQFQYNDIPRLEEREKNKQGYTALDPYIAYGKNFKRGFLGSNDVALTSRYYVPVTGMAKDLGYRNGIIRFDSEILWDLNKTFSVGVYLNPRIMLKEGSNMSISMREYAVGYINFNDSLQAYHMTGLLTGIASLEGRKANERVNGETGLNWTASKNLAFTFAVSTLYATEDASKKETQSLFDRYYSHENSEYAVTTSITF